MKTLLWCFFAVLLHFFANVQAQNLLIPAPQQVEFKNGSYELKQNVWRFSHALTKEFTEEIQYVKDQLASHHGIALKNSNTKIVELFIGQFVPGSPNAGREDYYELNIGHEGISILAGRQSGVFHGIQTLLQLVDLYKDKGTIPCQTIKDFPKFSYRGMHLDVVRHFFTVDEVKKYIDYLAYYKLNKFHWHLTDDQGWRIEIKSHPKLTEVGAFRKESQIGVYDAMQFDGKPYGGFYTQEQIKEVVAYASKRHVEIIPEIEMPGHAQAALAAYPELSCTGGPFEVGTTWGVMDDIFCPKEETFDLLEGVIDEVILLFPSKYIHIGGDEAPKTRWKSCAHCQELIKKEGLKDELGLQSYFITRMEKYINSKGKKIIGWDEILEGGLAPNATVMSWTGIEGGIHAAKTGHDAIMTPGAYMYFDHYQGDPSMAPIAFGGDTRLEKVYAFNPIPSSLTTEQAKHILGPQANMWTEYILDFKHVEYMLFPRLMALSEVAWGTARSEDYKSFEKRAIGHLGLLGQKGVNYSKAIFEVTGKAAQKDENVIYVLHSAGNPNTIRYTLDGTEPTETSLTYLQPILLDKIFQIKAATFEGGKRQSAILSQNINFSKSTGKPITLDFPPGEAYAGQGAFTLIDGIFGNKSFFGKNWLGFNGKDVVATIDLGKVTDFSKVRLSTLDRKGSWIHYPQEVLVYKSDNKVDFTLVKRIDKEIIDASGGNIVLDFAKESARYVKVEVKNLGIIPEGLAGAGSGAWLFVDEIAVD